MKRVSNLWTVAGLALATAALLPGQALRTWVSGVGDDANPCSRTAPCKTFAGAISKTAANGEISVLDPGGFGAVTVTKSITINAGGLVAGIQASGVNGVIVNAANAVVILRGLTIEGTATGLAGVHVLQAGRVVVENCDIYGFMNNGIDVNLTTGSADLLVKDTQISGGTNGLYINSNAGAVRAVLKNVAIHGATNGIDATSGAVDVKDSVISMNTGMGIFAEGTSSVNVDSTMFTHNGLALQGTTNSTIRISNSDFYDNQGAFGCGGILASAGNNRKGANSGGMAPVCPPNQGINVQ